MNLCTSWIISWKFLSEPVAAGQVGGHEGVGIVAQMGPFSDSSGVKIGDRVGIKWIAYACGNCAPCLAGADDLWLHIAGTFQQFVLAPAHYVTPIPEGLSSEMAAPLLCGGGTVYSALKKSKAQSGDWVSGPAASAKVLAATGGEGAAAVVVCSGNNAAYAQGLDFLKFNGILVGVGVPGDLQPIENACPHLMVSKQLAIVGSTVGNRRDAIETLNMAQRVVSTSFKLENVQSLDRIFGEMKDGQLQGRVVLDLQTWA
ncbi:hypothetical protein N7532_007984 [Penicillium argentinense]|uniref:Alcohol dehydrogenase n=1 Tax=Penicillium argentinense TaxID=1131581 RepID=A0A9W9EWS9_9EURO|nr:uncharacterized protein N7532_007984 [Penicillium argentinense]KAJ5089300.1 hypothetical protein N7532_007984 [Penicillium argentinense]